MKELIIKGTAKDVVKIMERIAKENPGMTIEEYLKKYKKDKMELE